MSVEAFIVNAEPRNDEGKGASRRLRREGRVPAVIYGGNQEPQSISLQHNIMLQHIENEAFFSHILTVNVAGKEQKAVVKDLQMHPYKPAIAHMDFLRVDESSVIKVSVPVHFIGEEGAPGVKAGGVVTHQMTVVEVSCPAGKLPEYLEADVSALDVGGSLHLSELKLPEGVEIVELSHGEEHDLPVVTIVASRAATAEEEEAEAVAPEEGGEEATE
jgi:large subunit ribosomal protein L25